MASDTEALEERLVPLLERGSELVGAVAEQRYRLDLGGDELATMVGGLGATLQAIRAERGDGEPTEYEEKLARLVQRLMGMAMTQSASPQNERRVHRWVQRRQRGPA